MELDDLKQEWQQRDQQLAWQLQTNNRLLRASYLERHSAEARRLAGPGWFDWVTFVLVVGAFGAFLAAHAMQPKFFIPALLLQAWVIAMHATEVYLNDRLRRLDFGLPVLALQKQLEAVKQWRLRRFKWGFLTGQVLWWIPFVVVLFKGLLGVDLYTVSAFMPTFILANVLVGLAVIPLAMWLAGHVHARWRHAKAMQYLMDSLSGRDVQYSLAFLSRLEEFEAPPESPPAPSAAV